MKIGPLRERVTIQSGAAADDSMGGGPVTWSSIATTPDVWAGIRPIRGDERLAALQLQAAVTHEVTMRYRTDVTAANRLLWGLVPLNIRAVLHDPKRRFTTLMVEQGVAT